MKIIIGAYSQFSFGSNPDNYKTVMERSLKPVLTYLYHNPKFNFVLRLSIAELEWMDCYHPDMIMLIKELCVKGQLDVLTSSYHDSIISLIPSRDRSLCIEKSATYLRKHFSKKPKGLWIDYQNFNSSVIPLMELSALNYLFIPKYCQTTSSVVASKPFVMNEMGKQAVVFPYDESLTSVIYDALKNSSKDIKVKAELKKVLGSCSNNLTTYMLNMDLLSKFDNVNSIYEILFNMISDDSILPAVYMESRSISRLGYLPSGVYGKDFSLGKALSVNQKIYENSILTKNYMLYLCYGEIIRSLKKNYENKSVLDELLLDSSCSSLYIPNETDEANYRYYCNKKLCEIEGILASNSLLPNEVNSNYSFYSKDLVCFISEKGAFVNKLNYLNSFYDFTRNCENGLFYDVLVDNVNNRQLNLSNKKFDIVYIDKIHSEISATIPSVDFKNNSLSIKKEFKLNQNSMEVLFDIKNIGTEPVHDCLFNTIFNLSLEKKLNNEFENAMIDSFSVSSKQFDFSIHCSFNELLSVSSKSVVGIISGYQYTQFRVQKDLDLNPGETVGFSVKLKVNMYEEIKNDIK